MSENIGEIIQVIGPVVDVSFEKSGVDLPSIYDALKIARPDGSTLIVECQQHIGEHTVRTIAMDSTDGLQRGMKVVSTGFTHQDACWRSRQGQASQCCRRID